MYRFCLLFLMGWSIVAIGQKPLEDFHLPGSYCQHIKAAGALPALTSSYPTDPRSDSIDILHIDLQLDMTNHANKQLAGVATLDIRAISDGVQEIRLDLLQLQVNSVIVDGQSVTYQYDGRYLSIPHVLANGDTTTVVVDYEGSPQQDASGWGGFYFTNGIAFNLGVGFAADPHNYGRVWYPCLDNFTEKSSYSFQITVNSGDYAVANGRKTGAQDNGDGTTTWRYAMNASIPSYLVSMAVGPYAEVEQVYNGSRAIPIRLVALPGDTTAAKNAFRNLNGALEAFETAFGPEPFGRVGYVMVPFGGGAMEHPTNIAYPASAANGSLTFETLMAHELAHHWWGDYVTCTTAEDMWLNEGWASYAEHLFLEHVYGPERYREEVEANHKFVLHKAHVNDNGFRAMSGVPHAYTYGAHSYQKGADVLHTLRSYMGDGLFFSCITTYLQQRKWGNGNSVDFMDHLTACSGMDLAPFFEGWVFQPGHPHFSIDSMQVRPENGQYRATIFIRQRLYGAEKYLDEVPLEVTFRGAQLEKAVKGFTHSGRCITYSVLVPFEPVMAALDVEEKISDAVSDHHAVYTTTQQNVTTDAFFDIRYLDFTDDTVLVRIEHHWVAPDRLMQPIAGLHLSDSRYWSVDGIWSSNTTFNARIRYNGSTASDGHLDNRWITNVEDSIVLLHRTGPGREWKEWDNYTVQPLGSKTDKRGQVDILGVQRGEYTLAIYDHSRVDTVVSDIPNDCQNLTTTAPVPAPKLLQQLTVFPNPANDTVMIEVPDGINAPMLEVLDQRGQLIDQLLLRGTGANSLQVGDWAPGVYVLKLMDGSQMVSITQLVIQR